MLPTTDQLRLLWAAALVAMPLAAGYRLARRLQPPLAAISDAILISYLIQYACVGVAGVLGFLSPIFLTLIALATCAALWFWAGFLAPASGDSPPRGNRRWVLGICLFAFGFMAALIYAQRMCPPLATDVLTYHLPAAVTWLQKKRMVLFQTWFFNPANTYSPLAGSMFITWLLAPIGNDSLARMVQVGPWVLVLFCAINLCKSSGASSVAAALAALAAVVSRPLVSGSVLAKDDLFVAAFFLAAAAALSRDRMSSRFGAARLGIAVGLMLATKYTAVLTLPILLLAADAPWRAGWRWRQWGIAIAAVAMIAGPWYLRNLVFWGNPLFPMKVDLPGVHFPGLLSSLHAGALKTPSGVWQVITGGYYGLPATVMVFLSAIWLLTVVRTHTALWRDPLRRMMVIGPPVGILVFALLSPQAEVRFLLPVFALMFTLCSAVAVGGLSIAVCSTAALIAVATSFSTDNSDQVVNLTLWGLALALSGILIRWLEADRLRLPGPIFSVAGIGMAACLLIAGWSGYLDDYRNTRLWFWQSFYPAPGAMWNFVDQHVPATATVAYSNEFMVYPICGFDERRRVVYAPVRYGASVSRLVFPRRISDAEINEKASDAANSPADELAWKRNLRAVGAEYLVVGLGSGAPEIRWADADPSHFERLFVNADCRVYRIVGE